MGRIDITEQNAAHYLDQGLEAIEDFANEEPVVTLRNRRFNACGYYALGVTPGFSRESPWLGRQRLVQGLGYITFRREFPPLAG